MLPSPYADMALISGCSVLSQVTNDVAELDFEGLHRVLKCDVEVLASVVDIVADAVSVKNDDVSRREYGSKCTQTMRRRGTAFVVEKGRVWELWERRRAFIVFRLVR